jgi:hypothetical protein
MYMYCSFNYSKAVWEMLKFGQWKHKLSSGAWKNWQTKETEIKIKTFIFFNAINIIY